MIDDAITISHIETQKKPLKISINKTTFSMFTYFTQSLQKGSQKCNQFTFFCAEKPIRSPGLFHEKQLKM